MRSKLKQHLLVLGLLLIGYSLQAAELITEQSQIQFSATQMGKAFTGNIERFQVQAEFDEQQQLQSLSLQIPSDALKTGDKKRDTLLQSAEWLASENYPQLQFSGQPQNSDGERIQLAGELEIKGTRQPLTLNVRQQQADGVIKLLTEGEIERQAYELGTGEWLDTKVVGPTIHFEAALSLKP